MRLCIAVETMRVGLQGVEDDALVGGFLFVEGLVRCDVLVDAHVLHFLLDFLKFGTECINCKGRVDRDGGQEETLIVKLQ